MKTQKKILLSNISFYLLLIVLFFSFMLMASCKENAAVTEPQREKYFDASLLNFSDCTYSSIPAFGLEGNPINSQQHRAQIYWFNIMPSQVTVNDILYDDVNVNPQEPSVTVLDIVFDPSKNGIYNSGELPQDLKLNWGGFARALPESVKNNFKDKNLVMKIWMKIESASSEAVLNVDLGKISEDIIPNGRLDSEDKNLNDILDAGEDTGIDGIFDLLEPDYNANDPNSDDFGYQVGKGYESVNGMENNGIPGVRMFPDTEDLNRNFVLDLSNDYFAYQIPLELNKIVGNKIFELGKAGWIQLKIPVDLPDYKIGAPDKNKMESLRLWISNAESKVHIKIAQVKFDEL